MSKEVSQDEIDLYNLLSRIKSKYEEEGLITDGPRKVEMFEPSYQFLVGVGDDDTASLWIEKETFEKLAERVSQA